MRKVLFTALISLMLVNTVSAQSGTPYTGGTMNVEGETYYLADNVFYESIRITAKNITLRTLNYSPYNSFRIGTGYVYDESQTPEAAVIIEADSVTIENTLVGGSNIAIQIKPGVTGCKIDRCEFSDNNTGIKLDSANYNQIIDCKFNSNKDYTVLLNNSSYNQILRNVFSITHLGDGFVLVNGSNNNQISDNVLNEGLTIVGYGIYIDSTCTGNFGEGNILIGKEGNVGCHSNGNNVNYTSTAINDDSYNIPQEFILNQNYPNPFNPETTIEYSLPTSAHVIITIYDIRGRQVKTLVDEFKTAGSHSIRFNGRDLSSGRYVYQIKTDKYTDAKTMLLIK